MSICKEVEINGKMYLRKDLSLPAENIDGLPFVIVRTYSAGVFAGFLKSKNNQEVSLIMARRLWKWSGAASLSQLAQEGTSNQGGCKFPIAVSKIDLMQVIEIDYCTQAAKESIDGVPIWKI